MGTHPPLERLFLEQYPVLLTSQNNIVVDISRQNDESVHSSFQGVPVVHILAETLLVSSLQVRTCFQILNVFASFGRLCSIPCSRYSDFP
jgi:hypothetical protein